MTFNAFTLTIDAPNSVSAVGDYIFLVSIWKVTLTIEAPCAPGYLKGLDVQGYLGVHVDEYVTAIFDFESDE